MHKLWNKKFRFLSVFLMVFVFSNPLYSQDSNADLSGSTVVISEPGGIPEQVLELFNKFTKQKGDSFSVDGKLSKIRAPDLDEVFLNEFNTKWQKNYGELSLKMLDVVSIKGSARFPDPRYVSFNDFAVREMLGGSPELTPQAGFSAAIANWMMLEHSINKNQFGVKYQFLNQIIHPSTNVQYEKGI